MTFRDVKADILSRITSDVWGPGTLLPSEVELAASYGCARATVNRAMRELSDEGIVERRRKAGTRVRMAPLRQASFHIPVVRIEIEEAGASYRHAIVDRTVQDAPDWLRARMQLDVGDRVVHLTCMHFADGAPYQFEDRWISLSTLPQAETADFDRISPNEWLVATVPFSNAEIAFSAAAADDVLAAHLGCERGAALFVAERATWWQGRAITHVRLAWRPGHRMMTRY
ncbi:UTRA domain-containing protein [Jannaschia rubra]|uniref:UTRA domain-containing protein n=1 Tax=Jannaschia rubra TaxID=282197 RepID=UPI00314519AA